MDQLDALRALAVGGVVLFHFASSRLWVLQWGGLGVYLFFVLSGFLITGILLRCRRLIHQREQSPWLTLRQFYVRRFLRIFPLFYFVLGVAWVLGFEDIRHAIGWHAAYLSDFYFCRRGQWVGPAAPFWSLAVEEQFYLVWPWLVLFLPQRWLLPVTAITLITGPLTRAWGVAHGWSGVAVQCFPLASVDALGLGAILAICAEQMPDHVGRIRAAALWLGLLLLAGSAVLRLKGGSAAAYAAVSLLACNLLFCWLVGSAADGFTGAAGRVLMFPPLILIGIISYGIYVYHDFAFLLAAKLHLRTHNHALNFAVALALAFLLPLASWYLYEKPINSLKRHFPYAITGRPGSNAGHQLRASGDLHIVG